MSKPSINIVWLKRDLRLFDHEPLAQAIADGLPCILLYCFEPSLLHAADSDVRHWRFVFESIQDLQKRLQAKGKTLHWVHAEVIHTLEYLAQHYHIQHLYSYAEVGTKLTFDRDKAVKKWCATQGILYQEFAQNGIIRGRKHRRGWTEHVEQKYFNTTPLKIEITQLRCLDGSLVPLPQESPLPQAIQTPQEGFQQGGESLAWRYFYSFLQERHQKYSRQMSKPEASRTSCSRLSPYLAFGCISARAVMYKLDEIQRQEGENWNLANFRSRVWWRSHFIQKLESNWRIELEPINPVFQQLNRHSDGPWLEAWCAGQTGFPMVDASMRCLIATGWVNFRMRAMLVSFASFVLWLDWRPVALHLARLFLDFDPGIHYSQIQMQAGLTGYHTLRIYNPGTQVLNHDPEGVFIKKWIPELREVPATHLAEPWKMTELEQQFYRCKIGVDYPAPLVEYDQVIGENKDHYWRLRQSAEAKQILPLILEQFCVPKDIKKYQGRATDVRAEIDES